MITNHPKYSGPGCSGTCICGHNWQDHHLGMVMNPDYIKQTGEYYIPQECEYYGCNEVGGLKFNIDTQEWEDHCHGYRDLMWPDEHN